VGFDAGVERQVVETAKRLDKNKFEVHVDRVFFTRGEGKIMDYLSRMCIGCLTSFSEGFSNALMEYMAAGLPVVATDGGKPRRHR